MMMKDRNRLAPVLGHFVDANKMVGKRSSAVWSRKRNGSQETRWLGKLRRGMSAMKLETHWFRRTCDLLLPRLLSGQVNLKEN
jgi:hypothetical protein